MLVDMVALMPLWYCNEFASWHSLEFKLYIIQKYKRLNEDKNSKLTLYWNLHREISKITQLIILNKY